MSRLESAGVGAGGGGGAAAAAAPDSPLLAPEMGGTISVPTALSVPSAGAMARPTAAAATPSIASTTTTQAQHLPPSSSSQFLPHHDLSYAVSRQTHDDHTTLGGGPSIKSSMATPSMTNVARGFPASAAAAASQAAAHSTAVHQPTSIADASVSPGNVNDASAPSAALICSIFARISDRLPAKSGWRLTTLECDPMVRMQVSSLIDLAPYAMPLILRQFLTQLDQLNKSFHSVAEDSIAGLDLLASQLFLVKVMVACLFRQWRTTNESLRHEGATDPSTSTGAPSSGEGWDDPLPLDDGLARRALSFMAAYMRHAAAREDSGLFIDPAMLDAPKPQAASKGASSRGRDALQRLGGRAGRKEEDADTKEAEREDRLFDGPHLLLYGGGAPLFSLLPSFPPSLTPFGPGVHRLPDQATSPPDFNRAWMDSTPPLGDTPAELAARGELDTLPSIVASLSRHAAMVVFYLSSSNWGVVFGVLRKRLSLLVCQARTGAPVTALNADDVAVATSDLRLLEAINATKPRLGVVLAELNSAFLHLRRPAQIVVASSLRRMIWSFILYRPDEFAALHQSNRRLDGGPDALFDIVSTAAESHAGGKRRAALWPLLSALLVLCPDLVARLSLGEGRKLAITGTGKKHAYYDALRKQLRQPANKPASPPEAPTHAAVDLVIAASFTRTTDASLRLVVPDLEPELRDKVFTPLRLAAGAGGARPDEAALASELLAALYSLDPARAAAEIIPGCLADKSTVSAKIMLARFALRVATGPGRTNWKPGLSVLYPLIALPLRHIFKDTTHSITRQTSSSVAHPTGSNGSGALSPSQSAASLATASTVTGGKLSFSRGSAAAQGLPSSAAVDSPTRRMELLINLLHLWQADFQLCTYGMSKDHRPRPPPEVRAPWAHDSFWADLRNVDTPLSLLWTTTYAAQAHGWEKVAPAALQLFMLPVWNPTPSPKPSSDDAVKNQDMGPWLLAARETVAPYLLLTFYERILWAESAYTRRLYLTLAHAVLLARLRLPAEGDSAAVGPLGGGSIGPTAVAAAVSAREAIQAAEAVEAEVAILLTLCSAETDISHGAAQLGKLMVDIATQFPEVPVTLPPAWRAFYLKAAEVSSPFAGRVAQQRNVRQALCDVTLEQSAVAAVPSSAMVATPGAKGAWAEAYRRWGTLTQIVARPMAADMSDTAQDKAAYWHNLTALLAALGGAVSQPFTSDDKSHPRTTTAAINALVSPKLPAAVDESDAATLVDTYVQEMVDLLVSDSLWVRDKVKSTLGQDLGVKLAAHLLKQVHIVLSEFFDKHTGLPRPSDMFTVFIEQSIAVVENMLARMPLRTTPVEPPSGAQDESAEGAQSEQGGPEPLRVDIGSLMVLYVEYANALGKKEQPLRIKLAVARLCATLLKHKASFAFSNEHPVRNRLFQALVTWTSESIDEAGTGKLPSRSLQRELDVACLRTVSMLLENLPLILADDALVLDDKVEWAKSRQFSMYFAYFLKVFNRAKDAEANAAARAAAASSATGAVAAARRAQGAALANESEVLQECAIQALSNLLAANIDSGLQHSLPLAYKDDLRIRTVFMRIMTNVLRQGAQFDDLERISAARQQQNQLAELIADPGMQLALSICQVCRGFEADSLDCVLLSLFDSRGEVLRFLGLALHEEIERTPSEEMVFRSNSFRTRLLSVYARMHGYEYLRATIGPLIIDFAARTQGVSFEIDPTKVDPAEVGGIAAAEAILAANQARLEEMAQAFIDAICSSAARLPPVLGELCRQIRGLMDNKFPESRYQGVGGFMFLRFISPAIVAPQLIDLNLSPSAREIRRGLLLVSKILQTLATNNVFPTHKEGFMTRMNDFLKRNVWKVMRFLDQVSDVKPLEQTLPVPGAVDDRALVSASSGGAATAAGAAAAAGAQNSIFAVGYQVTESDQHTLHKFLYDNVDKLGKDLMARSAAARAEGNTAAADDAKRAYDGLYVVLAEMGDYQLDINALGLGTGPGGRPDGAAYREFMRRNAGRHVDTSAFTNILRVGPPSVAGRPVLYYSVAAVRAASVDFEALIVYAMQLLQHFMHREYDLLVDMTCMDAENWIPHQWMLFWSTLMPAEIRNNLKDVIVLNANIASRECIYPYFQHDPEKAGPAPSDSIFAFMGTKSIHFVHTMADLEHLIPKRDTALPPATSVILNSPVETSIATATLIAHYRALVPVAFKTSGEYLQITSLKPQEMWVGMSAATNEVIHFADIDDICPASSRGEETTFLITCKGGQTIFLFHSQDRTEIVQALRQAKARITRVAPASGSATVERTLMPSDVPGTLLNMALLNLGSGAYALRVSAYNLLFALSTSFGFTASHARRRLLAVRGLGLPATTASFAAELSRDFAMAAPTVTLEFLVSFFEGFDVSSADQKTAALQYMVPWLANLALFTHSSRAQQAEYTKRIKVILSHLIKITVQEADVYSIMQRLVWAHVTKLDSLLPILLDVFVEAAIDAGIQTPAFEAVAETLTSFASFNMRGKLLARLRRTIAKTSKALGANPYADAQVWLELATLVRFNVVLAFTSRAELMLFLPESVHVLLLLAGTGPDVMRRGTRTALINLTHSLCTDDLRHSRGGVSGVTDTALSAGPVSGASGTGTGNDAVGGAPAPLTASKLRSALLFFASNDTSELFGLPVDKEGDECPDPFTGTMAVAALEPTIDQIEQLASRVLPLMELAAPSTDTANAWRARLVSLVTSTAFQYNPHVQSRAFILLGALAQGEIDDDLMYQILVSLRGATLEWGANANAAPLASILTCLAKVVRALPARSKYLPQMAWVAIAMLETTVPEIFSAAAQLLNAALITLSEVELPQATGLDPLTFLLESRNEFRDASCRLDDEAGVDFEIDFGFALASLLVRGLRDVSTRQVTIDVLHVLLRLSSAPEEVDPSKLDADDGTVNGDAEGSNGSSTATLRHSVAPAAVGLFVALLPAAADDRGFAMLLSSARIECSVVVQAQAARATGDWSVASLLLPVDNKQALLVTALLAALLDHAREEDEKVLLYTALRDMAVAKPAILSIMYEWVAAGMQTEIESSTNPLVLNAVQAITRVAVCEPVVAAQAAETARRGGLGAYLDEAGFASFLECGAFSAAPELDETQRVLVARLAASLLAGAIDAGAHD